MNHKHLFLFLLVLVLSMGVVQANFIIIKATNVNTTAFAVGNVSAVSLGGGLWNVSSTSAPTVAYNETHKVLWYGTHGRDPRISSAGTTGVTNIYSAWAYDVGKTPYYMDINYTNAGSSDGTIYVRMNFSRQSNVTAWTLARIDTNSVCDSSAIVLSQTGTTWQPSPYDTSLILQNFWNNGCNGNTWGTIATYDNTSRGVLIPNASAIGFGLDTGNLNGYPQGNAQIMILTDNSTVVTNLTRRDTGTQQQYRFTNFKSEIGFQGIEAYVTPVPITYFNLTAKDSVVGIPINTFNATFVNASDSLTFTTTNGSIVTNLTTNATSLYNISIVSPTYFSQSLTDVNLSQNTTEVNMTNVFAQFTITELDTGLTVSPTNVSLIDNTNGSRVYQGDQSTVFNLSANVTYNLAITKVGYSSHTSVYAPSPLFNGLVTKTNMNTSVVISPFASNNGSSVTASSVNITSIPLGVNRLNQYAVGYTTYNVTVVATGYATTTKLFTVTSANQNISVNMSSIYDVYPSCTQTTDYEIFALPYVTNIQCSDVVFLRNATISCSGLFGTTLYNATNGLTLTINESLLLTDNLTTTTCDVIAYNTFNSQAYTFNVTYVPPVISPLGLLAGTTCPSDLTGIIGTFGLLVGVIIGGFYLLFKQRFYILVIFAGLTCITMFAVVGSCVALAGWAVLMVGITMLIIGASGFKYWI